MADGRNIMEEASRNYDKVYGIEPKRNIMENATYALDKANEKARLDYEKRKKADEKEKRKRERTSVKNAGGKQNAMRVARDENN